jgi:hypothetical protein
MKAVLPNKNFSIVRNDGLAQIEMRAWMESVSNAIESIPDFLSGTGSPEGVVFAKRRSFYFNESGSSGTLEYVKTTDQTVNTGWVAIG